MLADDQAPAGRSTRRASVDQRAANSARAPNTWISSTASNVASRNGNRSPSACTRRGVGYCIARHSPRELAQHPERQVDADVVVARRDERPADPPGSGAEIEHAWPRCAERAEDGDTDRLRHSVRQRPMPIEARRRSVIG